VNGLRFVIEDKLYIVNESEQPRGELVMKIRLIFLNEFGARQGCNRRLQGFLCFDAGFTIPIGDNGMSGIFRWR